MTIQNVRQEKRSELAYPIHWRETFFNDEQTQTNIGDRYLLYDWGHGDAKMLIFATQNNLWVLVLSEHLKVDGTFKSTPRLLEQTYAVDTVNNNYITPIVHAFFSDKSTDSYRKLFTKIKWSLVNLQVMIITSDFLACHYNSFLSGIKHIFTLLL